MSSPSHASSSSSSSSSLTSGITIDLNVLNVLLLLVIVYLLYPRIFPSPETENETQSSSLPPGVHADWGEEGKDEVLSGGAVARKKEGEKDGTNVKGVTGQSNDVDEFSTTPSISRVRPRVKIDYTDSTSKNYHHLPPSHPEVHLFKKYTPEELARYDGKSEDGRILLAIQKVPRVAPKSKPNSGAGVRTQLVTGGNNTTRSAPVGAVAVAGAGVHGKASGGTAKRDPVEWEKGERTVFDVTAGKSFYGPDGPYGNFAGRDASRGMAKQSFDEDMLTPLDAPLDKLEDLTREEIDNMAGWHDHFSRKYLIMGELVENDYP